jgi:hypothetical protein
MSTFFLDLWHDLREKRLWPVAVGLLAAAIAIPAVMLKPASTGTVATPVVTKPAQPDALPAVEVDDSATHNSRLGTFSQRDPFKPMADLEKADSTSSTTSAGSTQTSTTGTSAKTTTSTTTTSSPGNSGGGSPFTTGTPNSSSTPSSDTTTTTTPVKWFRYTADISFGEPGDLKTLEGVKDFTLLPDDKTAAVVFMGVSNDAKSAIFFIADPAFTPSGEGECNDKQDCRFVKLSVDDKKDQETFTSLDGSVVYKLKLLQLKREYISPDAAQGDTTDSKAAPTLGKSAGDTITDANQTVLPRLLDLGSVASSAKK